MNRKTAIIIAIVSALALIAGVIIGVLLFGSRDRRALDKAFGQLSEDYLLRNEETVSAADLVHIEDEIVYGRSHTEFSVNIGALNVADMVPGGVLSGTDEVTVGIDGKLDRDSEDKSMSANCELSVMNYTLADPSLYAKDNMVYIELPGFFSGIYALDLSDISSSVRSSKILSGVWENYDLPYDMSVELFKERESEDILSFLQEIKESKERSGRLKKIWKSAMIERDEEVRSIETADGSAAECKVYHISFDETQIDEFEAIVNDPEDTSKGIEVEGGVKLCVCVDKYHDIRYISTDEPVNLEGTAYDIEAYLKGTELPIDTLSLTFGMADTGDCITFDTDRIIKGDDIIFDFAAEYAGNLEGTADTGTIRIEGEVTPVYDKEADELSIKYDELTFSAGDEMLFKSSGTLKIDAGTSYTAPVPDAEVRTDFDSVAGEIVGNVLGAFIG